MTTEYSKLRQVLETTPLVGRMINLQDVSDDIFEVHGRIIEIKLEGSDLRIRTEETCRRFWNEKKVEPFHQTDFSDLIEHIEEFGVYPSGTIFFSPWSGYDNVYILSR